MEKLNAVLAQRKAVNAELEQLLISERDNVLADMKEKMELFGFKYNDFTGVLKQERKKKTEEEAGSEE